MRNMHEVLCCLTNLDAHPEEKSSLPIPFLRDMFQTGTVKQCSVMLSWVTDTRALGAPSFGKRKGKLHFAILLS